MPSLAMPKGTKLKGSYKMLAYRVVMCVVFYAMTHNAHSSEGMLCSDTLCLDACRSEK